MQNFLLSAFGGFRKFRQCSSRFAGQNLFDVNLPDNIYLSLFVEEDGGDDVADGLLEDGLEVGWDGGRHSLRRHRLVLIRQAAQQREIGGNHVIGRWGKQERKCGPHLLLALAKRPCLGHCESTYNSTQDTHSRSKLAGISVPDP
jgi:hypothetical protein